MNVDTAQQEAIYDAVANGASDVIVVARAGTGKSTTIENALARVNPLKSVLVLAFNKEIAKSMQARCRRRYPNVEVRTCHSFGYKVIRQLRPEVQLDFDRGLKLGRKLEIPRHELYAAVNLAGKAKGQLVETVDELVEFADVMGIDPPKGHTRKFWAQSLAVLDAAREWDGTIDFDDMAWLPVVDAGFSLSMQRYDLVIVDEVQDLNAAQIELICKARGPEGRIVAVGDDRQSIYGFRGADRAAFESMRQRLNDPVSLPLSVSFRCPRAVIAEARREVPDIDACEGAPDGIVRRANIDECLEAVEYGDFILSRTNAPLIQAAMRLIATDCRVRVLGRDIGKGLVTLVRKLKANDANDLCDRVEAWAKKEITRQLSYDPPRDRAADLALDRCKCVIAVAQACQTVEEVTDRLSALFAEDKHDPHGTACVTLATTHQAKGLERDRVWMLRSTYLRPRKGVISQEERNLAYVAITRAKHELVFVYGVPGERNKDDL